MGIEYGFELGEPATVDRVVGTLARTATAFGMSEPDEVGFGGLGTEIRGGMLVSVVGSTPAPLPDPVERTFGIVAVLDVLFRFDRDSDSTAQRLDMMRLVAAVLADVPGDAVLEFAGEIVWLVRQGGRLTITSAEGYWTPELRALLPAHECAVLPNL